MFEEQSSPTTKQSNFLRHFTDFKFLIVFLLVLIHYISVAAIVFYLGKPWSLHYPTDSYGNRCGMGKFQSKPYLAYTDFFKCLHVLASPYKCIHPHMCVDECPVASMSQAEIESSLMDGELSSKLLCTYDTDQSNMDVAQFREKVRERKCGSQIIATTPIFRRCLPIMAARKKLGENGTLYTRLLTANSIEKATEHIMVEISKSSWILVVSMIVCGLSILVYLSLMRYIPLVVTWISIVLTTSVLLASAVYILCLVKPKNGHQQTAYYTAYMIAFSPYIGPNDLLIIVSTLLILIALAVLLCSAAFGGKMRKTANLLERSSEAISAVPSVVSWPIVQLTAEVCVCIMYVVLCLYMRTVPSDIRTMVNQSIAESQTPQLMKTGLTHIITRVALKQNAMEIMLVVETIWFMLYMYAIQRLTLSKLYSDHYEKKTMSSLPFFSVFKAWCTAVAFHSGTAFLGSLVIAVTCPFVLAAQVMDQLTTPLKRTNISNALTNIANMSHKLSSQSLIFSSSVYTLVVKEKLGFWQACKRNHMYVLDNCEEYMTLQTTGMFMLLFMCVMVATVSCAFTWAALKLMAMIHWVFAVQIIHTPVILTALLCFELCSSFMIVYWLATDVAFITFLQDMHDNDGSLEKPYNSDGTTLELIGNLELVDAEVITKARSSITQAETGKTEKESDPIDVPKPENTYLRPKLTRRRPISYSDEEDPGIRE